MKSVLDFVFGPEVVIPLLVLALALLLVGFRRQSGAVFLLSVTLVALPIVRGFLVQFFPLWVSFFIMIAIALVALRYVLGILLGDAANQTVGQLVADGIKWTLKLPFWLWKKLQINKFLLWLGVTAGRAGHDLAQQSGNYAKRQLSAVKARRLQTQEMLSAGPQRGVIAAVEGQDYYIDLGDGVTGILPIDTCEERLEIGQPISCRIVDQSDAHLVEVRLS